MGHHHARKEDFPEYKRTKVKHIEDKIQICRKFIDFCRNASDFVNKKIFSLYRCFDNKSTK